MTVNIFLMSGKKGSGKDTLAEAAMKHLRDRVDVVSAQVFPLASHIKRMVPEIFGFDPALCETREGKESKPPELCGKTVREALQSFGTEGLRNINPDIHCILTLRQIEAHYKEVFDEAGHDRDVAYFITDCRFENEAEFFLNLKDHPTLGWVNTTLLCLKRNSEDNEDTHASEDTSWWGSLLHLDNVHLVRNDQMQLDESIQAVNRITRKSVNNADLLPVKINFESFPIEIKGANQISRASRAKSIADQREAAFIARYEGLIETLRRNFIIVGVSPILGYAQGFLTKEQVDQVREMDGVHSVNYDYYIDFEMYKEMLR